MVAAAGARRRPDWRRATIALGLAGAFAGIGWWIASPPESPYVQQPVGRSAGDMRSVGPPPPAAAPRQVVEARTQASPTVVPDPGVEPSDLQRVFVANTGSADLRQRRAAARAFEACVPTFLPGRGEAPSVEPLIAALPAERRAEREAAYRALFARCTTFLRDSRESLLGLQQQLLADLELQAPGLRAQEALIAGRYERIDPLVSKALTRDDPAALASLTGIVARLAQLGDPPFDPDRVQRARAVDAALPWVACDLGLDCGVHSIEALQACAAQGACDGDMLSRLMSQAAADGIDPADVAAQHERLLALVRSGRALGTADLLP